MNEAAKRATPKSREANPPGPPAAKAATKRRVVVVAEKPERFPSDLAVDAVTYLSGRDATEDPALTVVNFCRSDRYLSQGYYVSLLADARGQKVLPTIDTLEAISSVPEALRLLEDVGVPTFHGSGADRRRTLTRLAALNRPEAKQPDVIEELSVFGRTNRKEIARLAARIHRRFPVPVCRLSFARIDGTWRLFHLEPIPLDRVENGYREQVAQAVAQGKLFSPTAVPRLAEARASLALLFDTGDPFKPSDQATLDRLERVAGRQGLRVTRIGLGDLDRVSEHDALFIRCLTGPDLPAFRFAQRAEALGIPVIDDTRSILRCGNKVYLAELLSRAQVPMPRTTIVQRGTSYEAAVQAVGSPFVLKVPDGSFSTAVYKVPSAEVWSAKVPELLNSSPMLIAQAWAPTAFDWRIGVLDGRPLYACRYWMVPGHWQIRGSTSGGTARDGRVEGVPLDHTPAAVKRVACRAARLIGDGLYGVDVKELETGAAVIEINDNPDVNLDYEDQAEGDRVYEELSAWFLKRIDQDSRREPRTTEEASHPERAPIGRMPRDLDSRDYRAYEVCGLEMEYALVDRDLEPQHLAEEALAAIAGRSTSEIELGVVGFSNEFFDHLIEMKTHVPLRSLCESEQVLAEGAARLARQLERLGARAMPTSMHPWLDPGWARRWTRSGRNVYDTYARLFDTATHGWANVQSCQVNLPLGREHEAVAMMNSAALLVPYLPAIAASSPMYGGELRSAVDNRLAFILEHQLRLPESQGEIVPEFTTSLAAYRRDVLKPIFAAVDRLENAETIRHEWLNARGAVFKFSRRSMEVRVVDSQECVKMDVAIAAFIRGALHDLSAELIRGKIKLPDHALLIEDFNACVRDGSAARVWAPHVPSQSRGDDGKLVVGTVIQQLILRAERRLKRSEEQYLELVAMILERGTLSERIAARLSPFAGEPDQLRDEARAVYLELCDCLENNRVWEGRYR